jgi:hypothetical protein
VWIAGEHLLNQRQLTRINIPELKQRIAVWQQRLIEK